MKKALSILLTILMIAAVFALPASAAGYPPSSCDCLDHDKSGVYCHCCVYCENLDPGKVTSCVEFGTDEEGKRTVTYCCDECTGIYPCTCGCGCCALSDAEKEEIENAPDTILTPDQQETIIEVFQRILGQIAEVFDEFFEKIFEFLRFDEIMGSGNGAE